VVVEVVVVVEIHSALLFPQVNTRLGQLEGHSQLSYLLGVIQVLHEQGGIVVVVVEVTVVDVDMHV